MSDERETKTWRRLGSERRYEDAFFAADEDRVIDPAGREKPYGVVRFKNVGLKILAVDADGCVFLVGQHRYGAGYYSWELPSGGQETDEDARRGASRELREEVGQVAGEWLDLLEVVPSGSVTDQRERHFAAWDLRPAERDPDPQEAIRVRRVPFGEAVDMALAGRIGDTGTIVLLLTVLEKARRGDLPAGLAALIGRGPDGA